MSARTAILTTARQIVSSLYARRVSRYPDLRAALDAWGAPSTASIDRADALLLYEAVRQRRPQRVLDLGCGLSTLVLATALKANGAGHVWAVEEAQRWLAFAQGRCPADLAPWITWQASPTTIQVIDGTHATCYTHLPAGPFDLVHVDGPSASLTADALTIPYAQGALIVFDGREAAARFCAAQRPSWNVARYPWTWSYVLTVR